MQQAAPDRLTEPTAIRIHSIHMIPAPGGQKKNFSDFLPVFELDEAGGFILLGRERWWSSSTGALQTTERNQKIWMKIDFSGCIQVASRRRITVETRPEDQGKDSRTVHLVHDADHDQRQQAHWASLLLRCSILILLLLPLTRRTGVALLRANSRLGAAHTSGGLAGRRVAEFGQILYGVHSSE